MGNPIYDTVRAGLADLVSDRAADAVLARGLAAAGTDAERVDLPRMSRMLRGVVRRELERTLPRAGVRKRLAALDRTLHDSAAADARPAEAAPRAALEDASAAESVASAPEPDAPVATGSAPSAPEPDPPVATPAPPPAGSVASPAPPPEASLAPVDAPASAVAHAPRPFPVRAIDRLAERDAVRQWVWIPERGTARGRGAGPAPDRVAAATAPALRVLNRYGPVRSVHVRHDRGQVVLGVRGDDLLVVAGDASLNVGAIRTTLRALEEEP